MLTKNSSNQDIQNAFPQQVETGKPFIYGVFDTANPEYQQLGIAQQIETPGSATDEQQLFLGWGTFKTIVRCLQSFKKEQIGLLSQKWGKIEPGTVLNGTGIRINESTTPRSWMDGERVYQSPKVYPANSEFAGENIVTDDTGEKIYRNTELVLSENPNHTFIQGIPESKFKPSVSEEVKATFEDLVTAE